MARKRKPRRERAQVETSEYRDAEGNVLVLRNELSAKTVKKVAGERAGGSAASVDDDWRRRHELLFERLTVRWEIAGLPLSEQKLLLGRYRMADADTQRWVRESMHRHIERFFPELEL